MGCVERLRIGDLTCFFIHVEEVAQVFVELGVEIVVDLVQRDVRDRLKA